MKGNIPQYLQESKEFLRRKKTPHGSNLFIYIHLTCRGFFKQLELLQIETQCLSWLCRSTHCYPNLCHQTSRLGIFFFFLKRRISVVMVLAVNIDICILQKKKKKSRPTQDHTFPESWYIRITKGSCNDSLR